MTDFRGKAIAALQSAGPSALITVTATKGSTPRERGAQMLVTPQGYLGSIGGGTLEWQAMAAAQAMLVHGPRHRDMTKILGPDLGQCCGGQASLAITVFAPAQIEEFTASLTPRSETRRLLLFGAGHVGQALVLTLAQSDFAVDWIDPRPGAFPKAVPGNVNCSNTKAPLTALENLPHKSMVLVMSHSHALDLSICDAALRNPAVAWLGLIGSATKCRRFFSRLRAMGHDEARLADLCCPIGSAGLGSKTPYAIAISTAHQLLALEERLSLSQSSSNQTVSMVQS